MTGSSDTLRRSAMIGGGLVAGTVLLGCSAAWFVLDPLKYLLVEAQRQGLGTGEAARVALAGVPVAGWALVAGAGLALAASVVMEFRSRAVSAACAGRDRLALPLVLGAVLLWLGHSYLYAGHLLGGDSGAHVARVAHFADGLRHGELRHWDNAFYGGATFLQFTGPAFFWLAGTVAWLATDPDVAVKLVLLALHFVSGWAVYRLLRGFGLSRPASAIGAIIYAGAFAHLHLILYKGALPQAITLALLPLAFLAADRLAGAPALVGRAWAATVLTVAGLVATHQPHGLVAGLYLAVYVLANIALGRYPAGALSRFAIAALTAGLLASFAVVPWLMEGETVVGGGSTTPLFWEWPGTDYFWKLLVWSNQWTSVGAPSVAYAGMTSAVLAAVAAIAGGLGRTGRQDRLLITVFIALLIVSFGLRGDFLRDIVFTLFFLAVLAGFGAERVMAWRGGADRAALLVLLLVFLDLAVPAVQPLARRDKDYLDIAGAYLSAAAPQRVLLANNYAAPGDASRLMVSIGPSAGPISYAPVQTLSGPHNMAATLLHNYTVAALVRAGIDLRRDGSLSPGTAQLLAMLNAGRIVNDNGTGMGLPAAINGVEEGPLGRVLPIAGATPAVFAPRLVEIAPPPEADKPALWGAAFEPEPTPQAKAANAVLDSVLAAMRFEPATAVAAAIPVRSGTPAAQVAPAGAGPAAEAAFQVLDYAVGAQHVRLRLRLPASGFVQLAHPWYPYQSVTVDGAPAMPLRGTLNLLVLPMQAGEHVVEVTAQRSPLRQAFGIGCGLLLAVVLAVALWPRGRTTP